MNSLQRLTTNGFYLSPDYVMETKADFDKTRVLPPIYKVDTQSKVSRIAQLILSILIFPIGVCQLLHRLIGKIFVIASSPYLRNRFFEKKLPTPQEDRQKIDFEDDLHFGYKRATLECDGNLVDIMMLINKDPGKTRWVLVSLGSGEFYEHRLTRDRGAFKNMIEDLHANALFFNYPGVGGSSGLPSKSAFLKIHRALLSFLEDAKAGLGAKQITDYASSYLGCGEQAEALRSHKFKPGTKCVVIKDRPASSISTLGSSKTFWPLGLLANLNGWGFNCSDASKKLRVPEIIIQTANVEKMQQIFFKKQLEDDEVIPVEATLARDFLERDYPKKTILGFPGSHDALIKDSPDLQVLAQTVEQCFT